MLELFRQGGWLMWPLLLCSILMFVIVLERFWNLRTDRVVPRHLLNDVWSWLKVNDLNPTRLRQLEDSSALGSFLSAGLQVYLQYRSNCKDLMKERMNEVGRLQLIKLERYLSALGTIAAISPLLGLLGTVFGIIEVFSAITIQGMGDPAKMAGGIAQALVTTAAGLLVGIPALIFHRYFNRLIDRHLAAMEQDGIKLIDALSSRDAI